MSLNPSMSQFPCLVTGTLKASSTALCRGLNGKPLAWCLVVWGRRAVQLKSSVCGVTEPFGSHRSHLLSQSLSVLSHTQIQSILFHERWWNIESAVESSCKSLAELSMFYMMLQVYESILQHTDHEPSYSFCQDSYRVEAPLGLSAVFSASQAHLL